MIQEIRTSTSSAGCKEADTSKKMRCSAASTHLSLTGTALLPGFPV